MKKIITLFLLFGTYFLSAQTPRGLNLPSGAKQQSTGRTFALIIGISKYQYLPSLKYADKDAEAFYSFLRSSAGGEIDSDNIHMILNEKACAIDIWTNITWLLRKANKAGDRAFIYFSGHGDAANPEEAYLLAYNGPNAGDPNLYNAGGTFQIYNLKFKIKLMTSAGVQVVLITDACRTNELPGKVDGSKWAFDKIMEKQSGEIQMASCAGNEQSLESADWGGGRGVFSYHLINGMAGMADEDQDGKVSFYELQRYLSDHVRKDTKSPTTGKSRENPVFCCGEYNEVIMGMKDVKYLSAIYSQDTRDYLLAGAGKRGVTYTDSAMIALNTKYDETLNEDKLIEPAKDCAAIYLDKMLGSIKDEDARADLSDRLVSKLINEAQVVINDYSKGLFKIRYDPGTFSDAALKLRIAMNYIQDKDLLRELNASRLFLEARELKNSGDIKDLKLGISKADSSLDINPNQAVVLHTLVGLYHGLKQFNIALSYELRAIALANNWGVPYANAGYLYAEINKPDSALYYLHKAISINPHHYIELGNYYYRYAKRPDSAAWCSYKFLEIYPSDENGYINMARFYFTDNKDSAIKYYKIAAKIKPGSQDSYSGLAELYSNLSLNIDSEYYYASLAFKINPKNLGACFNMGYSFLHRNNIDSAYLFFKRGLELSPNANGYFQMACFYSRINDTTQSLIHLEKSIQQGVRDLRKIEVDTDLAYIRGLPEFKALMKKYFPDQYKE